MHARGAWVGHATAQMTARPPAAKRRHRCSTGARTRAPLGRWLRSIPDSARRNPAGNSMRLGKGRCRSHVRGGSQGRWVHRQRLLPLLRLLRDEYLWHNHVHVHILVRDTARSCRSSTGGDSHLEEVGLGWVISWAGSAPSAKEGVYGAGGKGISVVVSGDRVWPDAVHEKRRLYAQASPPRVCLFQPSPRNVRIRIHRIHLAAPERTRCPVDDTSFR